LENSLKNSIETEMGVLSHLNEKLDQKNTGQKYSFNKIIALCEKIYNELKQKFEKKCKNLEKNLQILKTKKILLKI